MTNDQSPPISNVIQIETRGPKPAPEPEQAKPVELRGQEFFREVLKQWVTSDEQMIKSFNATFNPILNGGQVPMDAILRLLDARLNNCITALRAVTAELAKDKVT